MANSPIDRRDMSFIQKLSLPETSDPPWGLATAGVIVLVYLITLMLVGPALASIVLGLGDTITPFMLLLGWTLGSAMTIVFVLVNRRSSPESWQALKLEKGLLPLPFILMVGVATALFVDLVISLASGQFLPIPEIFGFRADGFSSVIVAGLFVLLIQPVVESLVFQGVVLPKLRVKMGAWAGTIITTAVFTIIHYAVFYLSYETSYPPTTVIWYGIAYPLIAGFVYCLIRVYTVSTRAVIMARIGSGLIFLLTALAVTGT